MYEAFFGFREKPFELAPDPDYLYLSETHKNVRDHLLYALREGKGFAVITGEVGSGKTLMLRTLLGRIPQTLRTAVVTNTAIPAKHLLKLICRDLEIDVAGDDPVELFEAFNHFLIEEHSSGHRVVLFIDEAQNLPAEAIEELRLLSNLDAFKYPLLQMILIGQPELREKLRARCMSQFIQRVTVHCHLKELSKDEVGSYVRHRLKIAGGKNPGLFDVGAIAAVSKHSGGVPRLINLLCDTALVFAYGDSVKTVGEEIIEEVMAARMEGGLFTSRDEPAAQDASRESLGDRENIVQGLRALELFSSHLKNRIDFLARDMRHTAKREEEILARFERAMKTLEGH